MPSASCFRSPFERGWVRWGLTLVCAWSGFLAGGPARADEAAWRGVFQEYLGVTNRPPTEAWVKAVAKAWRIEHGEKHPGWRVADTLARPEDLAGWLRDVPEAWAWRAGNVAGKRGEVARAMEFPAPAGSPSTRLLVLGARGRDQWLYLDPEEPGESLIGDEHLLREELGRRWAAPDRAPAGVLIEGGVPDAGGAVLAWREAGRILQRGVPNRIRFLTPKRLKIEFVPQDLAMLLTGVASPVTVAGPAGTDTQDLVLTPREPVSRPFSIIARRDGWLNCGWVAQVDGLVAGDLWLVAGGNSFLGLPGASPGPTQSTAGLTRVMELEPREAGTIAPAKGFTGGWWTNLLAGGGPSTFPLVGALAAEWHRRHAASPVPLGIVVASVGATSTGSRSTDLKPWQAVDAEPGSSKGATPLGNLWLSPYAGTDPQTRTGLVAGSVFRGMLAPLLEGEAAAPVMPLAGVVWLHGEWPATQAHDRANTNRLGNVDWLAGAYAGDLKLMIDSWRTRGQSGLPFVLGQLRSPPELLRSGHLDADPWVQIQMAQARVAFDDPGRTGIVPLDGIRSQGTRFTDPVALAARLVPAMLRVSPVPVGAPPKPVRLESLPAESRLRLDFNQNVSGSTPGFLVAHPTQSLVVRRVAGEVPGGTNNHLFLPLPAGWPGVKWALHVQGLNAPAAAGPPPVEALPLPVFRFPPAADGTP